MIHFFSREPPSPLRGCSPALVLTHADAALTERGLAVAAAPTPEPVARLVERILSHRRPKARDTVGMLGQRIVAPLKRCSAA